MARYRVIVLVGAIGLIILAGVGAILLQSSARPKPEIPIVMVKIVINEGQREAFFEKINQFSERNAFAIRIGPPLPGQHDYLIQLWREDVKVIGTNPFDPDVFQIGFYKNGPYDVPQEVLDYFLSDLEKTVNELPSVKFSLMEQKQKR